jgi:hypothetical protein
MKKSVNPEVISKPIAKLISQQEAIQKNQLAEVLYDKYLVNNNGDAMSAMTLMAFLYALEIENLATFLKARKDAETQRIKNIGMTGIHHSLSRTGDPIQL